MVNNYTKGMNLTDFFKIDKDGNKSVNNEGEEIWFLRYHRFFVIGVSGITFLLAITIVLKLMTGGSSKDLKRKILQRHILYFFFLIFVEFYCLNDLYQDKIYFWLEKTLNISVKKDDLAD